MPELAGAAPSSRSWFSWGVAVVAYLVASFGQAAPLPLVVVLLLVLALYSPAAAVDFVSLGGGRRLTRAGMRAEGTEADRLASANAQHVRGW